MRNFNLLRTAALAALLIANVSGIGTAFADSGNQRQSSQNQMQQQSQQPANTGPYDSPDFIVPPSDING
jgi:uncharacterized protein HemX